MSNTTFQQVYDKAYEHHKIVHFEAMYAMKLHEKANNLAEFIAATQADDMLSDETKQAFDKAASYFGVYL